MKKFIHNYDSIITAEKLLQAWQEFLRGKTKKNDVILFQAKLADNMFSLYQELKNRVYKHGEYRKFNISDPKPRIIHKAMVRDRLLHHLLYQELYPYFDEKFIHDSYCCRIDKGTHKAMNQFRKYFYKVSKNNTRTCWVLKCDIKKFFASIDHGVLKRIIANHIEDKDTLWLLGQVIDSFNPGLPLGNLTSQLLVNVYMNEFDQFVKHTLKVKYYIRYADDFVILQNTIVDLENILPKIREFLKIELALDLHPNKVFIKTFASGVDFLGWVHFPSHRVLRTSTKRKMLRNLINNPKPEAPQSYLGMLKHGSTLKLRKRLKML